MLLKETVKEEVQFDKILRRIKNLSTNLAINPTKLTQKVCNQIYPDIQTTELDELAAQICASMSTEHPDYGILSSNIKFLIITKIPFLHLLKLLNFFIKII